MAIADRTPFVPARPPHNGMRYAMAAVSLSPEGGNGRAQHGHAAKSRQVRKEVSRMTLTGDSSPAHPTREVVGVNAASWW